SEFNINAIKTIADFLGLTQRFIAESELPPTDYTATARLISIVKAVSADAYLSGGGSSGYQDDAAFAEAGIELVYQNFAPRPYGEVKEFIPGLSIIDWLMHRSAQERIGLN